MNINNYDGPSFFRNPKYSHDSLKYKIQLKKRLKKADKLRKMHQKSFKNDMRRVPYPKLDDDLNWARYQPYLQSGSSLQDNPLARIVANFQPKHLYLRKGVVKNNSMKLRTLPKSEHESRVGESQSTSDNFQITKSSESTGVINQASNSSQSSQSKNSVSANPLKISLSGQSNNSQVTRSITSKSSSDVQNQANQVNHKVVMPKLKKPKKLKSENLFQIMREKQHQQKSHVHYDNKPTPEELNEETPSDKQIKKQKPQEPNIQSNPQHVNHIYTNYKFPSYSSLVAPQMDTQDKKSMNDWILNKAEILNKTLKAFKVQGTVVDWTNGPTVTQFQVKLHLGVKVSKLRHLSDDLKMALAAKDIRIEAPIPGKTTCGIEIPNPKPRPVMLSEVLDSKVFRQAKSPLTIALGVDLSGHPRITNLGKMPHGLIAGATGSGKSVFINCMLMSLLYKSTPNQLRMILIDPKAVEFAPYNGLPHLITPVISEPKQAAAALKWVVKQMNQRYLQLASVGVRNIEQFNKKVAPDKRMPYILIVIDELADLMMVAGDEIETYIVRITQKARAAGIHLIVATQRPSVDVITGTMKNNIPTRVAFMVSSQVDSRTILDTSGAEKLLGKGDMLYRGSSDSHPIRLQGCFVSGKEINKVVSQVKNQAKANYDFHPGHLLHKAKKLANQDKLMPQVLKYIAGQKHISTSKLQRVFSIGYNRAAKIIDDLQQHNYISEQQGSKPRDVYLTKKDYQKLNL